MFVTYYNSDLDHVPCVKRVSGSGIQTRLKPKESGIPTRLIPKESEISMSLPLSESRLTISVVVPAVIIFITMVIVCLLLQMRRNRSKLKEDALFILNHEQKVFREKNKDVEANDMDIQEMAEISLFKDQVYENAKKDIERTARCVPVLSFWDHVVKKKANKEKWELEFQLINRSYLCARSDKASTCMDSPKSAKQTKKFPFLQSMETTNFIKCNTF
ncbi:hypothetical protein CHS0354_040090 [Potamilus streckersoni]|uniref:Uncharacterized protein n=1 Tax=Potamilus streckersoni TaxID=2493646 RepID=A0AAE0STC7_9BIVA|nr:hypothetical protein CHS0354_040090 [Potamilus streckersoni]